jgi:excisionase family DNA binding protein
MFSGLRRKADIRGVYDEYRHRKRLAFRCGPFSFVFVCYHLDMGDNSNTLVEYLTLALEEAHRTGAGIDWVDAEGEIMTVAEAAEMAECSQETIRRWCGDHRIGKLFAGSLWLVSRRRMLQLIERKSGKAAMLNAAARGKKHVRCLSLPHQTRVGATVGR